MDSDLTVGDLRRQLAAFDDDTKLTFGGGLTFYRLKMRGENLVNLEFNEPEGYLSPGFKQENPNVKVVFVKIDDVNWDEGGLLGGPVDVNVR